MKFPVRLNGHWRKVLLLTPDLCNTDKTISFTHAPAGDMQVRIVTKVGFSTMIAFPPKAMSFAMEALLENPNLTLVAEHADYDFVKRMLCIHTLLDCQIQDIIVMGEPYNRSWYLDPTPMELCMQNSLEIKAENEAIVMWEGTDKILLMSARSINKNSVEWGPLFFTYTRKDCTSLQSFTLTSCKRIQS